MRIYTADDEEPDCGRCDRVCSSGSCCDECGPEYGWNNYQRVTNELSKEEWIKLLKTQLEERLKN